MSLSQKTSWVPSLQFWVQTNLIGLISSCLADCANQEVPVALVW